MLHIKNLERTKKDSIESLLRKVDFSDNKIYTKTEQGGTRGGFI